jgi:hypothetical protein
MLKLRRSINQTLSCEIPRILPLAPCVPSEDVPPTRIPRTARDRTAPRKVSNPWAPLESWFSITVTELRTIFHLHATCNCRSRAYPTGRSAPPPRAL